MLVFNIFLFLKRGIAVVKKLFNWSSFIASYISIPTFFVLCFGFKFWFNNMFCVALAANLEGCVLLLGAAN